MELHNEIDKLLETLKREREELGLKIHLGKMEAREEWERAERKWEHFKAGAERFGSATKEASKDVGTAAKLLGEELHRAYGRIRKSL